MTDSPVPVSDMPALMSMHVADPDIATDVQKITSAVLAHAKGGIRLRVLVGSKGTDYYSDK